MNELYTAEIEQEEEEKVVLEDTNEEDDPVVTMLDGRGKSIVVEDRKQFQSTADTKKSVHDARSLLGKSHTD